MLWALFLKSAENEDRLFVFEVKEKKAKSRQSPGIEQSSDDMSDWCRDWTISVPPVYEEECEAGCPLVVAQW